MKILEVNFNPLTHYAHTAIDTNIMTNLEKIKQAWKFNYGATLELPTKIREFQVLSILKGYVYGVLGNNIEGISFKDLEFWDIKGYRYLGELGGNEEVPEGQRFRDKETGEIGEYVMEQAGLVRLSGDISRTLQKSKIEPVFD